MSIRVESSLISWPWMFSEPVESPPSTWARLMSVLRASIWASSWLARSTAPPIRASASLARLLSVVEMREASLRKLATLSIAAPRWIDEAGSPAAAAKAE
jgi:hypothetical protein